MLPLVRVRFRFDRTFWVVGLWGSLLVILLASLLASLWISLFSAFKAALGSVDVVLLGAMVEVVEVVGAMRALVLAVEFLLAKSAKL